MKFKSNTAKSWGYCFYEKILLDNFCCTMEVLRQILTEVDVITVICIESYHIYNYS